MKNKLSVVRKAGGGAATLLLAGCMLTVLCFNPWTAHAVTDGETPTVDVQNNTSVTALEDASRWDGDLKKAGWGTKDVQAPDSYHEEDNSVTISGADGLAYFAYKVATDETVQKYTVELTCDIDLDNHLWIPIGLASRDDPQYNQPMFSGTFNGGGHTIYNLNAKEFTESLNFNEKGSNNDGWLYVEYEDIKIDVPTRDGSESETVIVPDPSDPEGNKTVTETIKFELHEFVYGLFGVTGNAEINNLNVANVNIDIPQNEYYIYLDNYNEDEQGYKVHRTVADGVGSIVGYAAGNIKLNGCTTGSKDGRVSTSEEDPVTDIISGVACAGGLVGRAYSGLENGKPYGKIDSKVSNKVVNEGFSYGAVEIKNCTNYVSVGESGDGDKKGGIIGYTYNNTGLIFENCKNYGDVNGTDAGGITSYWQTSSGESYKGESTVVAYVWKFINCTNYGNVTGATNVGGIVGRGSTTSAPTATKTQHLEFDGCKNYGKIKNIADPTVIKNSTGATGGIIGRLNVWAETEGNDRIFKDNFNYGTITGLQEKPASATDYSTGGLIGFLGLGGNISGISGGNYGRVSGYQIDDGCIGGKTANRTYNADYLINAYAVSKGAN